MKLLNNLKFSFILILCAALTSCEDDEPVVCNSITVQGGNNQGGVSGQALSEALQVRVTDGSGNSVSNTTVRWEVLSGGGSLSSVTSTTNSEGIATSNWTYGNGAGRVRASIDNASNCNASSVEFSSEPLTLSLNTNTTRIEPVALNDENNCYGFNYAIGINSNGDLSNYFIDIEGEYQYESATSPSAYFATGTLSADGNSVTFQDCFQFLDNSYIDDWFLIRLYNLSDIVDGEPIADATPVVTSNRIGPIRTERPDGAPRLATGTQLPRASRGGR